MEKLPMTIFDALGAAAKSEKANNRIG